MINIPQRIQTLIIDKAKKHYQLHQKLLKFLESAKSFTNREQQIKILKTERQISPIAKKYQTYCLVCNQLLELNKEFQSLDVDFKKEAKKEEILLQQKKNVCLSELYHEFVNVENKTKKNIIIEIRGATGGEEANLFAADLYRCYVFFSEKMKWHVKLINSIISERQGFTEIIFSITGENVYTNFQFESGIHRVQRVPETESKGRVHTSTASVVVQQEPEAVEVAINSSDLRIDTYRSSGAGGQHVNTTDSAVRITHLPTGIVTSCQNERSQHQNKENALRVLRAKLYKFNYDKKQEELNLEKRAVIGGGTRSEKIRTYNYPQSRITDHRIHFSTNQLQNVMSGDLQILINPLQINFVEKQLIDNSKLNKIEKLL